MATPDVRVRLSAEGEKQVVDALRRVASESQKSGRTAARGVDAFASSLRGAQTLLAGLAAVAGTGALLALGKEAADAADQLGKMSQKLGTTVENLSALRFAASTADVSMEQLQKASVRLSNQIAQAADGSKEAQRAFANLGVSIKDLRGKDAAEQFTLVATAIGRLQDGPEKTARSFAVFGREAANLIPLFNDLAGGGGLQGAIDKAREFGVLLSSETARAAQAINDDFTIIKEQVLAGAARFVEGLAPAIHAALGFVQEDLASNKDRWKEWGAAVGITVALLAVTIESTIDRLTTSLRKIGNAMRAVIQTAAAFARGGPLVGGAEFVAQETGTRIANEKLEAEFQKRQEARAQRAERIGQAATSGARSLPELRAQGPDEAPPPRVPVDKTSKSTPTPVSGQRPFTQAEALREQIDEVELAFRKFDAERSGIEDRVRAGLESQIAGQVRLVALDKARIAPLREQADALRAAAEAAGDEDAIARAIAFGQAVDQLALNVEKSENLLAQLGATALDAFGSALKSLLTDGLRDVKNLVDAFRQLGLAVLDAINQLLAAKLVESTINAIGGAFKLPGFARGGLVRRAGGGLIAGPGSGTSDSIPALLSNGEFVVRSAVVQQPGMVEALESLNRGLVSPALASARGARRFAGGGLVSGAGETGLSGTVTVALEEGLVARHIEQPSGQRAVIRAISKQPRGAGAALGQG